MLTASGSAGSSSFAYNLDGQPTARTDAAGTTTYGYDPPHLLIRGGNDRRPRPQLPRRDARSSNRSASDTYDPGNHSRVAKVRPSGQPDAPTEMWVARTLIWFLVECGYSHPHLVSSLESGGHSWRAYSPLAAQSESPSCSPDGTGKKPAGLRTRTSSSGRVVDTRSEHGGRTLKG
ncbi:hypothetical protein [Actinomadura sp. 9N215]|uniref:hypothetical protein n=1 Tax=Actinomadura sp. 9N215 TaxID=3375150 RepID=UPI003789A67D